MSALVVDERTASQHWAWVRSRPFLARCDRLSPDSEPGRTLVACDSTSSAISLLEVLAVRGVPRTALEVRR